MCGSEFTIRVAARVTEGGGRKSDGRTPRNDVTYYRVHRICAASIIRSLSTYRAVGLCGTNCHILVKYTRDSIGKWLVEPEFQAYIAVVG